MSDNIQELKAKSVVGFNGSTFGGLCAHPDGLHVVYPMGAKLVVQNWTSGEQSLLEGHTSDISAVAVSSCGKFLASGQILKPPFHKASVFVWSFETRSSIGKHEVHGSTVRGVSFSCDSQFLYSLGGLEDHTLAVWDMKTSIPISCKRLPKALQSPEGMALSSAKVCSNYVISSSEEGILVWEMELKKHQLNWVSVNVGKLKRNINCMMVDADDSFVYCGTTTGDVVKVRLNLVPSPPTPVLVACLSKPPLKGKKDSFMPSQPNGNYSHGVRAIVRINSQQLAIGAGDGTVDLVEEKKIISQKLQAGCKSPTIPAFKVIKTCKLRSMVTSLTRLRDDCLLVGTRNCDIFSIPLDDFQAIELHVTCHPSPIHSIALPQDTSEVFVTSGYGDLRIWRVSKKYSKLQEVLRIQKPGLSSGCVLVTKDGCTIISAWDDGAIRAYTPESGKLVCEILGAHRSGVSALGITSNTERILSGGKEGQVRVWDSNGSTTWTLTKVFAEQRGTISHIAIRDNNQEAASACEDGTCYIWGIRSGQDVSCKQTIQTNSKLSAACFVPGPGSLILTAGSDRRVVCWDTARGTALRDIETHAPITSLDVPQQGNVFITGFEDGTLKVWCLLKGEATHCGVGHGAPISCVAMSHDKRFIFSASTDGAIFCWECPHSDIPSQRTSKSGSSNRSVISKTDLANVYKDNPVSNRSSLSKADLKSIRSNNGKTTSNCGTINKDELENIHKNQDKATSNHNTVSNNDLVSIHSERSKHSIRQNNPEIASARVSITSEKKQTTAKNSTHSKLHH